MTDKPANPAQPERKEGPAPQPRPVTKGGTAPLNQKPAAQVDSETQERLKKMLSDLRQSKKNTESENKAESAPEPPAADKPEKPGASATTPNKAPAATPGAKSPAWPEPAKKLGDTKPAPPGEPGQERPSLLRKPGAATEHLNRPTADNEAGSTPKAGTPRGSGLLSRMAPSIRTSSTSKGGTTIEMRRVPKGQSAKDTWKVLFQAVAGTEIRSVGVEVKGLTVVGRADPENESKPDLDLTPFAAREHGVSRQHAILFLSEEGPCMIDLDTTNGTWINGLYLEPGRKYRLRNGDRVELGSLKVLVRVVSPDEQESAAGTSGATTPAADKPKPSTS